MTNAQEKIPKSWFYSGKDTIRKANINYPYTEQQINEIKKCKTNFNHFFKKYVKIISLDEGIVYFKLRKYQKKMIRRLIKNRFNIFMLPRQSGKSIVFAAYSVWKSIFTNHYTTGIVANKAEMSLKMIKDIKFIYSSLPFWLQQGVVSWGARQFELENGSIFISAATSGSALRGYSINNLIWDEAAFVKGTLAEDFLSSVYPTIASSKKSQITITSTPFGYNHFAKFWFEAKNKKSKFIPFEIAWNDVPGRNEKFKKETIANVGEQKWYQEFECKILGSSSSLITGAVLESLEHRIPILTSLNENLKIYENPIKNHQYVIITDTSEGLNQDYNACIAVDATSLPYKQVAAYRNNKISYRSFPYVIDKMVRIYGEDSVLIVENNNLGLEVVNTINEELETPCVIFSDNPLKKLGVRTTSRSRNVGCNTLKDLIELKKLEIIDYHTISELYKFVLEGKKYQAAKDDTDATDDLVMCLVLFSYFTTTDFFKEYFELSENEKKKLSEIHQEQIEEDLPPIGIGHEEDDEYYSKDAIHIF